MQDATKAEKQHRKAKRNNRLLTNRRRKKTQYSYNTDLTHY